MEIPHSPPRIRIRRRGADKHPLILQAARDLVAESGFREAQMSLIAEAAGIAIGTLYRYFPSTTELLVDLVKTTAQREVDVVAGIAMRDGTALERLGAAAWTFASRALRGRRLAYALVAEPVEPDVEAARLTYHRALARVFKTIIEQGMANGEFPAQDAAASAAFSKAWWHRSPTTLQPMLSRQPPTARPSSLFVCEGFQAYRRPPIGFRLCSRFLQESTVSTG